MSYNAPIKSDQPLGKYSNFSFLHLFSLLMSTMCILIGAAASTQKRSKPIDLCLTSSQTIGLAEPFNQNELLSVATAALPQFADNLSLGACLALSKIRALISNQHFNDFVSSLRASEASLTFRMVCAFLFQYQNSFRLPKLE